MKLSKTAEDYYQLTSNPRILAESKTLSDDVNRILGNGPRSGASNRAAADVLIKRWEKLVDIRVEVWVEAYELDNKHFEKADVEQFFEKLQSGADFMAKGWCSSHPRELALGYIVEKVKPINLNARLKLFAIMKKRELEARAETQMRKKEKTGIHITGPNIGSTFQFGDKSTASTTLNIQFNRITHQLREEFEKADELEKPEKDEALKRIDKLAVLASREASPKRLEKVKRGVETLASIASRTKDLLVIVTPLLEKIREHWPNIQW